MTKSLALVTFSFGPDLISFIGTENGRKITVVVAFKMWSLSGSLNKPVTDPVRPFLTKT